MNTGWLIFTEVSCRGFVGCVESCCPEIGSVLAVSNNLTSLPKVFGILLCHDSPDIHPPFMCHGCYNVLMRSKNAEKSGTQYQSSVQVFTWEAVCNHIGSTRTGGRPKKQRKPGRPPTISTRTVIDHVHSLAPPSFIPPDAAAPLLPVTPADSASVPTHNLLCEICSRLLDRPVQLTPCNNLVCMSCLCKHLKESGSFVCPCCNNDHLSEFTTITQPSSIVTTVLGRQKVTCSLCNNSTALGNIMHV